MIDLELAKVERLFFDINLNEAGYEKHVDDVQTVTGSKSRFNLDGGGQLKVTYTLNLHYFGDIVEKLEALQSILEDHDSIVKVNLTELKTGESIIVGLLDRLRALKNSLKSRN